LESVFGGFYVVFFVFPQVRRRAENKSLTCEISPTAPMLTR
jgi:hypothetical protein